MESDTEELRQKIAIGLEAAERGEAAPLDIEAAIAEGKRRLAQSHLDALLQKGLDSGNATPMTAQNWKETRKKVHQNSRPD